MPPWWNDPVDGVIRFLESNLSRGKTIPIKVQFLGTVYNTPKNRSRGTTRWSGRCSSPRSAS